MFGRYFFLRSITALCAMACVLIFAPSAYAVSLTPALFDYSLNPGESIDGAIRVQNETSITQMYELSAQNFVPNGENGQQTFIEQQIPEGLMTWISFETSSFTLTPNEQREIHWTIQIPENAEPGGHYAAGFFSTQTSDEGSTVGIGTKTGVLFLINVSGNVRESLEVESFQVSSRNHQLLADHLSSTDRIPLHFDVRLRNTGSVHVKPEGTVTVTDTFGRTKGIISLNSGDGRVLPGSIRRLATSWGQDEEGASGFVNGLRAEWRDFEIGRFTATLDVAYGRTGQRVQTSNSFWIFPWRTAVVIVAGLFFFEVFIKGYNRWVIRRAVSRSPKK